MKSKFNLFVVFTVLVAGLSVAAALTLYTSAQERKTSAKHKSNQSTKKELDDTATPIVDLDNALLNANSNERTEKSARYDKQKFVPPDFNSDVVETLIFSHILRMMPDFPVAQSDLIVEGTVADSTAHLSNDRGGVYSEFTINVTDVLKATSDLKIVSTDSIVAERFGGRVKYPNGKVIRFGVIGQGSPVKNKKYLFFLSKAGHGNYKILTGYEVQGNKVFPLDGSHLTRGNQGNWNFDKHNNQDYQVFREQVERVINSPQDSNKEKEAVGP